MRVRYVGRFDIQMSCLKEPAGRKRQQPGQPDSQFHPQQAILHSLIIYVERSETVQITEGIKGRYIQINRQGRVHFTSAGVMAKLKN